MKKSLLKRCFVLSIVFALIFSVQSPGFAATQNASDLEMVTIQAYPSSNSPSNTDPIPVYLLASTYVGNITEIAILVDHNPNTSGGTYQYSQDSHIQTTITDDGIWYVHARATDSYFNNASKTFGPYYKNYTPTDYNYDFTLCDKTSSTSANLTTYAMTNNTWAFDSFSPYFSGQNFGWQPYGIQVGSIAANDWVAFKIQVPITGDYSTSLVNAISDNGGIGNIYLAKITDPAPRDMTNLIGTVDFYAANYQAAVSNTLKTVHLDAGEYRLCFKVIGKNPSSLYYNMYPGDFKLTQVSGYVFPKQTLYYDFSSCRQSTTDNLYARTTTYSDTDNRWTFGSYLLGENILRWQPYGMQVGSNGTGNWFYIQINVPTSGDYSASLTNALHYNGGIANVYLTSISQQDFFNSANLLGSVDFYNASYVEFAPATTFGTKHLDAGEYILSFRVTGKNTSSQYYNMYPGVFTLTPVQ